jgi:hypothetical protein
MRRTVLPEEIKKEIAGQARKDSRIAIATRSQQSNVIAAHEPQSHRQSYEEIAGQARKDSRFYVKRCSAKSEQLSTSKKD